MAIRLGSLTKKFLSSSIYEVQNVMNMSHINTMSTMISILVKSNGLSSFQKKAS